MYSLSYHKFTIIILFCILPQIDSLWANPFANSSGKQLKIGLKKQRNQKYPSLSGTNYLEVGGGIGLWYQSIQPGMEPDIMPVIAYVEYGNTANPVSYVVGTNFVTTFRQDIFLLKPTHAFIAPKLYLSRIIPNTPTWLDVYALAGPTLWQGSLTERNYGGVVNYENKVESDMGFGLIAGAGAAYRFNRWAIGMQFTYLLGEGEYLAGGFEKQRVNVGSTQLNLLISYRFGLGSKNAIACPTYH